MVIRSTALTVWAEQWAVWSGPEKPACGTCPAITQSLFFFFKPFFSGPIVLSVQPDKTTRDILLSHHLKSKCERSHLLIIVPVGSPDWPGRQQALPGKAKPWNPHNLDALEWNQLLFLWLLGWIHSTYGFVLLTHVALPSLHSCVTKRIWELRSWRPGRWVGLGNTVRFLL